MKSVVCVPYYGAMDRAHAKCMNALRRAGADVMECDHIPYLDIARSRLMHEAAAAGYDVAVCIDHDMIFEASAVDQLARQAFETGAVVAAAYARKEFGAPPICGFDADVGRVTFGADGGLVPARLVGLGFTAIPLRVLDVLDAPRARVFAGFAEIEMRIPFAPMVVDGAYIVDDQVFCHRLRAAGVRILIDTRIRVLHRGMHSYALEDSAHDPPRSVSLTVDLVHQ